MRVSLIRYLYLCDLKLVAEQGGSQRAQAARLVFRALCSEYLPNLPSPQPVHLDSPHC